MLDKIKNFIIIILYTSIFSMTFLLISIVYQNIKLLDNYLDNMIYT